MRELGPFPRANPQRFGKARPAFFYVLYLWRGGKIPIDPVVRASLRGAPPAAHRGRPFPTAALHFSRGSRAACIVRFVPLCFVLSLVAMPAHHACPRLSARPRTRAPPPLRRTQKRRPGTAVASILVEDVRAVWIGWEAGGGGGARDSALTAQRTRIQVWKSYDGQRWALQNINLEIDASSLVALVGPSGSGKTTLLRLIAGLERSDRGSVWLNGRDMSDCEPRDRNVGFLFQNYALFPYMTVRENVSFGLDIRGRDKQSTARRVKDLLELVRLEHVANRLPHQLSGGQRQRIALARSLALEPEVLLLDEPFGALDVNVRKELRRWLRDLHEEIPVTTVFVTHDQEEAMEIASEMVIFDNGGIEQVGTPVDIYDNPATPFVKNFVSKGH